MPHLSGMVRPATTRHGVCPWCYGGGGDLVCSVGDMRVLVGCEESQKVTRAFRKRGHEAYSCDILPTRGNPEWHIRDDIVGTIIASACNPYDLILLFPDCAAMALSGNRWYGRGMKYHHKRKKALQWTVGLWWLARRNAKKGVCLENPASVIFPKIAEDDFEDEGNPKIQWIQPWMFGHGEVKKTGLALYNLPRLEPTNIVEGREPRVWKMGPSPTRKRDRSETYQGIADAMAEQWGGANE